MTIESGPAFFVGDIDVLGPEAVHAGARSQLLQRPRRRPRTASSRSTTSCAGCSGPGYFASVQAAIDPDPEQAAQREAHGVGDRGAGGAPRVRRGLLDRHASTRRAPRTATWTSTAHAPPDVRDRARRDQDPAGGHPVRAAADARRMARHLRGRRAAHRHREPRHAHVGRHRAPARDRRAPARRRSASGSTRTTRRRSGPPTEYSHALYVDGEYTWRNVDDLLQPTRGWMANAAGRRRRARRVDARASAA